MNLTNATLLALEYENLTWGVGFRYSTNKTLEIEGLVLDLTNSFGVSGIHTGIREILDSAQDYQPIILNGYNFGSGVLQSLSFSEGNDVRKKTYNATILVYESGDLSAMSSQYYSGFNLSGIELLTNFDETFSFNRKENGGMSFEHQASVTFASGLDGVSSIQRAKNFAKSLFTGVDFGFLVPYSGIYNKQGRKLFSENYDLIDNACSFSESFDFDRNSGNYSVAKNHRIETNAEGITLVSENATIRGLITPTHESARQGMNTEFQSSYARCANLFTLYSPSNAYALKDKPTNQTRILNIFEGIASYEVSFDNDPKNSGSYFWDFSYELSRDAGIVSVLENGTIQGISDNRDLAYQNAKLAEPNIVNGIEGRLTDLYNRSVDTIKTLYLKEQSRRNSPYKSSIDYSVTYDDRTIYVADRIKEITFDQSDNIPVRLFNTYRIPTVGELVQNANTSTAGERVISLQMIGENDAVLDNFLSGAKTIFNDHAPSGSQAFIQAAQYEYLPNTKSLNISVSWYNNETNFDWSDINNSGVTLDLTSGVNIFVPIPTQDVIPLPVSTQPQLPFVRQIEA